MLLVGGRPVMDHLVERMRAATGDLVVVSRPEKTDVTSHARRLGLDVVEGTPRSVSESLLLGLREADSDHVLVGFPDTIWEPVDGYLHLLVALREADVALGCFESEEPERSDVVVLDGERVAAVRVKPDRPPSSLVWGCAAVRATALSGLVRHNEPGNLFDELARHGRVRGMRFPGELIDVGTPAALERARARFG